MGLFDRIERSGEAVANRLVHKDAQPLDTIEITSKLIETMDKKATAFSRDRTVAPNVFQVSLAPINFDQINAWGSSVLASEMSQELIRHAHTQGYSFIGQIAISFAAEPSLNPHAIHVNAFTRKDASAPVTRPTITSPILDINGQRYMLTGPVTIIAWSFPRNDLPLGEIADQIGLALRDEVSDLEAAGIAAIQVDEPALRELLPLDADRHADYLNWSVGSFRLATSCVRPDTQIHTHLCYSEFGQIIDAIKGLDADVTSIEAARSKMEVVPELAEAGFDHGIGPGVWDIHAPRVPSTEELAELIGLAADAVPVSRLWVNPDCGLKTRGYEETKASLDNLVSATRQVRAQRGLEA